MKTLLRLFITLLNKKLYILLLLFSGLNSYYHEMNKKTTRNLCLLQQTFKVHFVSKVTPIHFIDGNNIGLICNSMVGCSNWN